MALDILASSLLALGSFLAIRLVPLWTVRDRGTDAFFYQLCAEAYRKRRALPIVLPELFLLEPREQWYPPLFPVFLGILPEQVVRKWFWAINHLIDAVPALLLFLILQQTQGPAAAWAGLGLYAITPDLVAEYQGLVSRPMAALLFFACMTATASAVFADPAYLVLSVFFLVCLIYTHKLTMQLLWFLLPFLSLVRGEPVWVATLLLGYAAAAMVRWPLFVKVVRAHMDIVAFWHRNWPWLGAHQVKNSPIYGDGKRAGFHGLRGRALAWRHVKSMLIRCPWAVPAFYGAVRAPADPYTTLLAQLLAGTLLWAALTLFLPRLRCLGDGIKYVKYTIPVVLLLTLRCASTADTPLLLLMGLAGAWHMYCYFLVLKDLYRTDTPGANLGVALDAMALRLRGIPGARVACIPVHLADGLAYKARTPVLSGGHGYGFRSLEPFFPVLRTRLQDLAQQHGITHFLIDTRYTDTEELGLAAEVSHLASSEHLSLYEWRPCA